MRISWDDVGAKRYETGVDRGVLFVQNSNGAYGVGVPWNGLTGITENSNGGDSNAMYADNRLYGKRRAKETFKATVEAYTYPDEFEECDGSRALTTGVLVSQQKKRRFGISYRTLVGNDAEGDEFGYKLHIVWDAMANPTEKAYETVNDNPDAVTFRWEISSNGIEVEGYDDVASITLDSTQVPPAKLAEIEAMLYGTASTNSRLPTPEQVLAAFKYTADDLSDSDSATVLDHQNAAIQSRNQNF